jgi:hypothetical protein
MDIMFPRRVRAAIYITVVLGTAVLVPLNVAGAVSDLVMSVWTSVAAAASALAALNVSKSK